MKIPNAERAVVDLEKLRGYSLDPNHRIGRYKARLFAATLRMSADDAEILRNSLLEVVKTQDAEPGLNDGHGQRYRIDFTFEFRNRTAMLRSAWIVRAGEDFPRLTTCYPLKQRKEI